MTPVMTMPLMDPLLICPMGSCSVAWPEADLALARAATRRGLPYTLSTMATISIEDMADAVQGRLWFQLYVLRDKAITAQLVERARVAGYEALVVTVDLPAGGKRERARYSRYAKATFRKDRRVNIRLSSKDLEAIQKRALAEGLPYQTLIASLLHKYAAGRLKEV